MNTGNRSADLLEDAATILEVDGWCQGSMRCDDGRRCMLGALTTAWLRTDDKPAMFPVFQALVKTLSGIHIHSYNDTPGRTAQEVVDALKQTATRLRAQETP